MAEREKRRVVEREKERENPLAEKIRMIWK